MLKCLPVSLEEVGVAGGLPPDGRVDAVVRDVSAVIGQLQWVAWLQVGLPEEPVPVPWRREGRTGFNTASPARPTPASTMS